MARQSKTSQHRTLPGATPRRRTTSTPAIPPAGTERTLLHSGTSGYAYKEWLGTFYPEDLSSDSWLSYYASQLSSVEINNTFYRMPRTHVVEQWCAQVPEDFKFVFKASRRISHQKRLKDVEEATEYLGKRALTFGSRLGCVLLQLPPNMRIHTDRLQRFIELLPHNVPCAFEFRHPSWAVEEVDTILRQGGHTRVTTDDDEQAKVTELEHFDWHYLRLRRSRYTKPALVRWGKLIQQSAAKQAYVYFKHEDAGAGPKLAARFAALYGEAELTRKPAPRRASRST
ncbi:MAG: DUF72 domain-containing protein [Pseudomonadota bacterium]